MNNLIKFSQVNSILTIIMHLSTSKQISKPQLTTIAIPVQFLDTKLVFPRENFSCLCLPEFYSY